MVYLPNPYVTQSLASQAARQCTHIDASEKPTPAPYDYTRRQLCRAAASWNLYAVVREAQEVDDLIPHLSFVRTVADDANFVPTVRLN